MNLKASSREVPCGTFGLPHAFWNQFLEELGPIATCVLKTMIPFRYVFAGFARFGSISACSKIDLSFFVFDILNQFQKNRKDLVHADFLSYLSPSAIKFRIFKSRITSCASKSITPIRPVRILKFETQNVIRFLNIPNFIAESER